MESKWYYFPGQTPENTNISDRAHALHITKEAWSNITHHLGRKQRIQEAIDKEQAHKAALKQGSEAMTKEWPNSVQNLRLRKEEERRNRFADKKKEDKIALFYKMRAEQEAVRTQYVEKVKKEVFRSHGSPKELTSALILAETLYEQEKQREFNDGIKKHEQEVKKQYDENILASVAQLKQEQAEEDQRRRETAQKLGKTLRNQIKENEETRKTNNRARVERETRDRINADREEELIKKFEFDEKMKKRRSIAADRKKALLEERERQEIIAKENDEMEKATEIYSEAKKHIECLTKIKDKEMREEAIEYNRKLANKVAAVKQALDSAEDERIAKVVAERDAEEKAKAEAKAALQKQAVRDLINDRNHHMKILEREKRIDEEMKRWEMLNRIKTADVMKEYDEQNKKEKWAKILQYRRDLLDQMADDKARLKREKEIEEIMSRVSFEEADKMFFEYADEVMKLAKSKNRPTYPIEKVITGYKTANKLSNRQRPRCYRE